MQVVTQDKSGELATLSSYYKAVYEWCIRRMKNHASQGNSEQVARWGTAAAKLASGKGFFGAVADPELERILLMSGIVAAHGVADQRIHKPKTVVHVLTQAYQVGGHTRLCQLWIGNDTGDHVHHVILTSQEGEVPDDLVNEVVSRGGGVCSISRDLSFLERAERLRHALCHYDGIVVLHTHMYDVVPTLALSGIDGLPVLFLNHADHQFWIGIRSASILLEIRQSGLELSRAFRGVTRSTILPIPLLDSELGSASMAEKMSKKSVLRKQMGIHDDAVVYLTIGSEYKYRGIGEYDFLKAAERILEANWRAIVLVVGPYNRGKWAIASEKSAGRLRVLGELRDVGPIHVVSDIYLEGFPCGSLTALLEAGLFGLPCIGAPGETPPLLKSDDSALGEMVKPIDFEDYVRQALELGSDLGSSRAIGDRTRGAILAHHCGQEWGRTLDAIYKMVPDLIHPAEIGAAKIVPDEYRDYWMMLQEGGDPVPKTRAILDVYSDACKDMLPLEGGIDGELAVHLETITRDGGGPFGLKRKDLAQLFGNDGYLAYKRGNINGIGINIYRIVTISWNVSEVTKLCKLLLKGGFRNIVLRFRVG